MTSRHSRPTQLLDLPNEILIRIASFMWDGVHFGIEPRLLDKNSEQGQTLATQLSSKLICKRLSPIMTGHLFHTVVIVMSPKMMPILKRLEPLLKGQMVGLHVFFDPKQEGTASPRSSLDLSRTELDGTSARMLGGWLTTQCPQLAEHQTVQ